MRTRVEKHGSVGCDCVSREVVASATRSWLRAGISTIICLLVISIAASSQSTPGSPAERKGATSPQPTVVSSLQDEEFDLLYEDRYFYIDNQGLTRVHVVLNGHRFKLASDPAEVQQGSNTYLMPSDGEIVIDLFRYMKREGNRMRIHGEGPPGAEASIIVADQVFGGTVHYVLHIDDVPGDFTLSQNYPNPFNPSTDIVYNIPDQLVAGERVYLAIYSMTGERVKVLVDERRFPGTFTVRWNGDNDRGEAVSSGAYLYQITAGFFQTSRRLVLLR
ncbi:MAG: hypothetical protein HW412_627 [Bacteroidetes bacterium]|nr:hypothetical protein [Bacteroidota bacterium]